MADCSAVVESEELVEVDVAACLVAFGHAARVPPHLASLAKAASSGEFSVHF
jgi:hypothetical protein